MVFIPSMYGKLGDGLSLAISFTNIIFMLVQSKPLLRVWHRLQTLARKIVHISEILHIDQKTREHPMPSPNFHHPHIYGPKSMYIPNLHCGFWGWNYTKDPSQLRSALLQAVLQNWGVNLGGRKHGRTMEPQNEYSFLLKDPFFVGGIFLTYTQVVLLKSWLLSFAMKLHKARLPCSFRWCGPSKKATSGGWPRDPSPKAAEVKKWTHA